MCWTHSEMGFQRPGGGSTKSYYASQDVLIVQRALPAQSTLAGKMLGLEFSKTGKCKSRIKEEIKTQRKAFYKDRQAFSAAFLSTMCLCVFAGQMIVQSLHY